MFDVGAFFFFSADQQGATELWRLLFPPCFALIQLLQLNSLTQQHSVRRAAKENSGGLSQVRNTRRTTLALNLHSGETELLLLSPPILASHSSPLESRLNCVFSHIPSRGISIGLATYLSSLVRPLLLLSLGCILPFFFAPLFSLLSPLSLCCIPPTLSNSSRADLLTALSLPPPAPLRCMNYPSGSKPISNLSPSASSSLLIRTCTELSRSILHSPPGRFPHADQQLSHGRCCRRGGRGYIRR